MRMRMIKTLNCMMLWCLSVGFAIAFGVYGTAVIWGFILIRHNIGVTWSRVGVISLYAFGCFIVAALLMDLRHYLKD